MRFLGTLALAFASCASLRPGEVRVFGRIHEASPSDIRAAIVANQHGRVGPPPVHHVEVVNSSEIRVYHTQRGDDEVYDVVRCVDGRWQITDLVAKSNGPI